MNPFTRPLVLTAGLMDRRHNAINIIYNLPGNAHIASWSSEADLTDALSCDVIADTGVRTAGVAVAICQYAI